MRQPSDKRFRQENGRFFIVWLRYGIVGNETLLKSIVESRPDITSAGIISRGKMAEIYGRPGVPMPPESDMKRMILQTELLVGMITTNERVVGDTRFIIISHADLSVVIVPVMKGKSLVVVFTAFRDIEGLTEKVLEQSKRIA